MQYFSNEDLENFIIKNSIRQEQNILLQIFTSVCEIDFIDKLVSDIIKLLPNINIIGTTTDGEIIDDEVKSRSTVLSFSIFENTNVKIYAVSQKSSSFKSAKKLIKKIEDLDHAKVAIVFTDGLGTNGELFLQAFNQYASGLTVAGGLAGDNAAFTKTFVFTQDGIDDNFAVCALLYNPDLIVNGTISFGWEAIGKEFLVTKAVENRVYTIDNKTPIELYDNYLGKGIAGQLPMTGIEFPFIMHRDAQQIARAVIDKEDDGSLIFAGNINNGDKIHFGYGNVEHILKNISSTFQDIEQSLVESIFVYSCMARKRLLGDDIYIDRYR